MSVTIKEIAEMAGVHRSTVDKVLHNRPGVSDPVRKRIQKIIDECNYQINPIGKALKMQERKLQIKVLLLEVDAEKFLKTGIETGLQKYGSFQVETEYHVTRYTDPEAQVKALQKCLEERPDGVILSPINIPEEVRAIDECVKDGIPVVTVNTDIKGSGRICYIGQDGFKAGRIAGRLMGEFLRGSGKVAVFTSDGDDHQSFPFGTREDGFREIAAKEFPGLTILKGIRTQEETQIIRKEMRSLCEKEPDLAGIYITCGGVKAVGDVLEEYGRSDVKLVCYENYPEILAMLSSGTVTAALDSGIEEQGKTAMEVLLDYLIYDIKPSHKHLYSEIKILLKESL